MLTWEELSILSYGKGTPSTTLALMSCENAIRGYQVWPEVPVYSAVIYCELHAEPSWVYKQGEFVAKACAQAGIPYYELDSDLYGDFTRNFGRARVASIPFWTLGADGKKGRMPRQCTFDYKIKLIERFVRRELLCYAPGERAIRFDVHAHEVHMGIMWEERRRAKPSKLTLFKNKYPLVEMGWTRADCFAYNKNTWGLETWASSCVFCPFHTNYYYSYMRENEPENYARALQVDELVEKYQARPPLKCQLFLTKDRKRIRDLTPEVCNDAKCFTCEGELYWDGF